MNPITRRRSRVLAAVLRRPHADRRATPAPRAGVDTRIETGSGTGADTGPDTDVETGPGQPPAPVDDERTVRIARRRFTRRQWTRRWRVWRRLLATVLVLAVLVGAGWLVFFSSALAVAGVQVAGTRVLAPTAVRRAADVPLGQPLATVGLDAISARVENLPAVAHVDVSRSWPDHVRIEVTERRAVAVVESGAPDNRLSGVDDQGVLFRSFARRPARLPVIRRGVNTGADALAEAARVAGSLPASLNRKVAYVEVRTVDRITLEMRNGRQVRWGSADGSSAKATVLAALLSQKASFYDVSVPAQPVIRR